MLYTITIQETNNPDQKHEKEWNIEDNEDTAEVGRKVVDIIATINENKDETPFEESECEKCFTTHEVDSETGMCVSCGKDELK